MRTALHSATRKGQGAESCEPRERTPLFEMCPTALLFGMWDSTGPKGGLGPKFERAVVSEIVGVGAEWHDDYRGRGVRRDPLEVRAAVKVIKNTDKSWRLAKEEETGGKKA
jgi:CRISPR-associated protein Csb1